MRRLGLLLGGAAAALLVASAAQGTQDGATAKPAAPIRVNAKLPDRLVVVTPVYKLTLSKDTGAMLALVDRRTGAVLVRGQGSCAWTAELTDATSFGACAFNRAGPSRFSYRWNPASTTLTLRYAGDPANDRGSATVTLVARRDFFDLGLALDTHLQKPVFAVHFPADLVADVKSSGGVYTPTFLPGIKLLPSFFSSPRRNVERYPSRWAFADFMAADVGRSHLALYSVNPAPSPIAPVDVGVIHDEEGTPCAGSTFCLTHAFQTWLAPGTSWTSPTVRVRVGGSAEESILAYRADNGIDRYPSLSDKLGSRLDVLSRAPLVKADLWKGLPRFGDWGPSLRRLPSPALLHPVAFQERGHDEDYPDFLPPDPEWGTTADFNGALADARSLGDMVMPYLNVSWWDTQSPTIRALPPPLTATDVSMQTSAGAAVTEQFGPKDGYIVSPFVPFVRDRVARLMEEWRTEVPAECLFFDQIGARPWRRDFNPAAPTPLAYDDGWLAVFARYRDRCLMVEDGWDRLADAFVGFHGGVLEMQREHGWPERHWGAGNWEPYPLALWLMHDKVLTYQHDLYEKTMTTDPEVLLFNVAFGQVLSYNWRGDEDSLGSPWVTIVGAVQRTLGPHYAGRALTGYRELSEDVTETDFGDYSVVANWSATAAVDVDGYRIAPRGFLARETGRVLAAALGDAWTGVTIPGE